MKIFVFFFETVYAHFCNVLNQLRQSLILVPMFRYLLVLSLLLPAGLLSGQGWERVFDGGGTGQINGIALTPDGGYITAGYYNNISRVHLLKTDADGFEQWTKDYFLGTQASGEAIMVTKDGGYIISGFTRSFTGPRQAFVMKTDHLGNVLWTTIFPGNGFDAEGLDVVELPDEDAYVVCGYQKTLDTSEDVLVFKVDDTNGAVLWNNTFGLAGIQEKGFALAVDPDGNLLVAGERRNAPSASDMYVVRVLTTDGSSDWENTYSFGTQVNDVARDIEVTEDGGFILAGQTNFTMPASGIVIKVDGSNLNSVAWQIPYSNADLFGLTKATDGSFWVTGSKSTTSAQEELFIAHFDDDGEKLCQVPVGRPGVDRGYSIIATPDGGAVAAGSGELFVSGNPLNEESLYMVKTDKNCLVFTSYIFGNIFHDYNTNCTREADEPGLEDWIVKIESPNYTRYAAARSDGSFDLLVDTGTYKIILFPPNDSWESCDDAITLPVTAFSDTFSIDIPVRAANACPRNEVDLATPILRKCTDNRYTVRYCNSGTIPSLNTTIVVTLDPALQYVSSSNPNVTQGPDNTLLVNIGFLENGKCGSFTFDAFLSCDAPISATYCAEAHIYPDSFCNATQWDGSIVAARAECNDGKVNLILENIGNGDMMENVGFVIAEDVIMLTQPGDPNNVIKLKAKEDFLAYETPATGKTYRIIAGQTPGYPGTSYPTAAIERCLSDTSNAFTLGYFNMFPADEAEPFKASDCQETYDTDFNPDNLKRGHPKGYDVPHYVFPQTDLEFLIQFQNSGTDTVNQVIVRDTLSEYLDPATVLPGAASHPYDFDVYGPGIVQFTLPNLNLLPGSGASEGFVTFRVSQRKDVEIPCGTEILNSAAIYFDFDAPVFTNQTFHTVCDSFLVVKTKHIEFKGADVKVYPNPLGESAQFEITGVQASGFRLELYDLQGKQVLNQSFNHPTFRLYRHQLPAGTLFYRLITDKGQPIASGKLLVQ